MLNCCQILGKNCLVPTFFFFFPNYSINSRRQTETYVGYFWILNDGRISSCLTKCGHEMLNPEPYLMGETIHQIPHVAIKKN